MKKISSITRNQNDDEINAFLELHKINYVNLKENLINNKKEYVSSHRIFEWKYFNCLVIKSYLC